MADTKVTKAYVEVAVVPDTNPKTKVSKSYVEVAVSPGPTTMVTKQYVEVAVRLPVPVPMEGTIEGSSTLRARLRGISVHRFILRHFPVGAGMRTRSRLRGGAPAVTKSGSITFESGPEVYMDGSLIATVTPDATKKQTTVSMDIGETEARKQV